LSLWQRFLDVFGYGVKFFWPCPWSQVLLGLGFENKVLDNITENIQTSARLTNKLNSQSD